MFSGLTNQVTSWMGAVKGEPHDEEVPTPTQKQMQDEQQHTTPPPIIEQSDEQQPPLEQVPINEGEKGQRQKDDRKNDFDDIF